MSKKISLHRSHTPESEGPPERFQSGALAAATLKSGSRAPIHIHTRRSRCGGPDEASVDVLGGFEIVLTPILFASK